MGGCNLSALFALVKVLWEKTKRPGVEDQKYAVQAKKVDFKFEEIFNNESHSNPLLYCKSVKYTNSDILSRSQSLR